MSNDRDRMRWTIDLFDSYVAKSTFFMLTNREKTLSYPLVNRNSRSQKKLGLLLCAVCVYMRKKILTTCFISTAILRLIGQVRYLRSLGLLFAFQKRLLIGFWRCLTVNSLVVGEESFGVVQNVLFFGAGKEQPGDRR